MISLLAYSNNVKELHTVKQNVLDLAAYLSEEKWETNCFSSLEPLRNFLLEKPLINLACYDVSEKDGREYLVPAIDEVIIEKSPELEKVTIRPLKGIFDDEN